MTHQTDPELLDHVLQLITDRGTDGLAEGIRLLVNAAMRHERSAALQAKPYERTDTRKGYANGFKDKTVTTRMGAITFDIPQVRGDLEFYPSALEKGLRSERALKLALAERYVQGVSTRRVAAIVEQLCGTSVSSTHVSQCSKLLDTELQQGRERPLASYPYLVLDARYEKVRQGGVMVDGAVLLAMGVGADGKRVLLGVSVARSEAEVHGRAFLQSLVQRGLWGVQFGVRDDHPGLQAARRAVWPGVPWQRCQFHLQQNAQAYVPRLDQRAEVARALRSIFNSPTRPAADRRRKEVVASYAKSAPKLAAWLEENLPQGLTVFVLPPAHQTRLRTANAVERVNQELKRRTRVARIFPNEASLLRLLSALAVEISEDWEAGKIYLAMTCLTHPPV